MSPTASDYGKEGDQALVPGTLRVFRHFQFDRERGLLAPFGYRAHINYEATVHQTPRHDLVYQPGEREFVASCNRRSWVRNFGREPGTLGVHPDLPAPQIDCSCGFYAHYDPATDFYSQERWGKAWTKAFLGEASPNGRTEAIVLIRAVCEASGRVVMGRRGVRAEKLRIVAIAVDSSKQLTPADPMFDMYCTEVAQGIDHREELRLAKASAEAVAEVYGVEFWDSCGEMYEAYPKADVSALGVEEVPPGPNPYDDMVNWGRQMNLYTQMSQVSQAKASSLAWSRQLGRYVTTPPPVTPGVKQWGDIVKAMNATTKAFEDTRKAIARAFDVKQQTLGLSGPTVEPTAFEKAIEAKRNRPAPPGSGIDRRKRKL